MQTALTDQRYWDGIWNRSQLADVDPGARPGARPSAGIERGPVQRFFDRVFAQHLGPGRRFLEIGVAGSPWPARVVALGADVWGIDISAAGLELVARSGVPATLIEGDFFDRSRLPLESFDVVYSGGFLEHFVDSTEVTRRMAELTTRSGVVVTAVPNLSGLNGWLQRKLDFDVWQRHIELTPDTLDESHAAGGLEPLERARYVGVFDLGWVNFARLAARMPRAAQAAIWRSITMSRRLGEAMAQFGGIVEGGRILAPMVAGVYRRRLH
jgi:SAM-dependent methyltransferase